MEKTALFATNQGRKVKSKAGGNNGKEETVHEIKDQDDRRTADRNGLSLSFLSMQRPVRDARQPGLQVERLLWVDGCR